MYAAIVYMLRDGRVARGHDSRAHIREPNEPNAVPCWYRFRMHTQYL